MKKSFFLVSLFTAMLPLEVRAEQKVPVSIHGVNYSNEDFSFALVDPEDPKNGGAGELVGRFSGGGTVCCYSLPKTWHPGIKVLIKSQHWLKRDADGKLPEINETHTVEVPRYADDKASDVWVLRQQDGSYAVVSSKYQPNHEKWPGKVKGWPVPSREYQLERIALQLKEAERAVRNSERARVLMEQDPVGYSRKMWEIMKDTTLIDSSKYSGPEDTKFQDFLRGQNEENLIIFREKVKQLEAYQP
ncbi:DUF3304 domain-containing protein [Massilia sp. TN1-12]|uniref:DUF3304 domain-containing protein n=1 Tax=Massilia paldalensis TaxID=3377675 RepID=UPI0038503C8F